MTAKKAAVAKKADKKALGATVVNADGDTAEEIAARKAAADEKANKPDASGEAEEAHDELLNKMPPTGEFVVRKASEGNLFRLYNESGQAVSGVTEDITRLSKDASRSNMLIKSRASLAK